MVLLCFQFFKERGAEISYKTSQNTIQKVFPSVKKTDFPITVRLTLQEYLDACGIERTKKSWSGKNTLINTPEYTEYYLNKFVENGHFANEMRSLREYRDKSPKNIKNTFLKIDEFLTTIQYPTLAENITKNDVKYLTGGWFEEYVYSVVQKYFELPETNIALNLNIGSNNAPNELDVVFVLNNNIYVFECKTGLSDGERSLFNDTMYKIAALRKDFGLMASSYLFTLGNLRDNDGNLQQKYEKRAGALGVGIVDEKILLQSEQISEILNRIKSKK